MGKRSRTVALIVIVGLIGLIGWQIWRERPPTYHGKTAAQWFREFSSAQRNQVVGRGPAVRGAQVVSVVFYSTGSADRFHHPAAEGLRALGTNAVLCLANEIVRVERPWGRWEPTYTKIYVKLPKFFQGLAPAPPIPQVIVRQEAIAALRVLGTNSAAAVPLLRDRLPGADPFIRAELIDALRFLPYRGADFDPVLDAVAGRAGFGAAMDLIGKLRLTTPNACTVLGAALMTGDASMKQRALLQLTYIGPNARLAVPALITVLTNTDKELRYSAASALAEMGPDARSAAPALAPLTNDVSELVQHAARRALFAISSGAARKPD